MISEFWKYTVCLIVAILVAPLTTVDADQSDTRATLVYRGGPSYFWRVTKDPDDKRRLYKRNVDDNEVTLIYETDADYIVDIRVAPSDTIIAILIEEEGVTPPGAHGYSVPPRSSLMFIDLDGNEIGAFDEDVRKFSWSPDGEKVAYITGTYYEGGVGFKTTGVGILDLRDFSQTSITADFPHRTIDGVVGGGFEINWARHDGNVYIEDFGYLAGRYKYDANAGKSEPVEYKGISFSPDGKYYILTVNEGTDGAHVFETSSNEDLTGLVVARFGYRPGSLASFNWVFDRGHILHYRSNAFEFDNEEDRPKEIDSTPHNVLYDLERDEVLKEDLRPLSRWTAGPGKLVLEQDGEIIVLTYGDVYDE